MVRENGCWENKVLKYVGIFLAESNNGAELALIDTVVAL